MPENNFSCGKAEVKMKRIYANEKWCLACHLCEYYCAFANSKNDNMIKALKNIKINPRIKVEDSNNNVSFAVSCRHCDEPLCVKSCITGALTKVDGIIKINSDKCVKCYTCILVCPYGAVMPSDNGVVQKCELCIDNAGGVPACVKNCPNAALSFRE